MPLLIIAGIVWIVLALMTNVLPAEGFWAARRLQCRDRAKRERARWATAYVRPVPFA